MAAQHNNNSLAMPLTFIETVEQQINHLSSPNTIILDAHNNYIDAEQVAYEEVASVISNKDDPNMLCLTFRVWFIGLLFVVIRAFSNQYFWYRTHWYTLGTGLDILLSFLIGKFFAYLLPTKYWSIGSKYRFSFNPGPFTFKEHILIFVMNDAAGYYGISLTSPFDAQRVFFNKSVHYITAIIFSISLYLMVFGIVGIMRRFLVWPSSLLWPENLPYIILIRTLNDQLVDGLPIVASNSTWQLSRLKFFIVATICQCLYYWLPNYAMPILLAFGWLCWFQSNSLAWSQLTGTQGFGIGSLKFDWTSITFFWQSPIIVPLWAKINILIGFVSIVWILSPLCFYTNFLELHFSPIRTTDVLLSKGYIDDFKYYTERPKFTLNETKYKLFVEQHGEVRWSVAMVLQVGVGFLLITSLIVHTILYHGHDILQQARTSGSNRNNDIHYFLMSQYPDTPDWWFTIVFVISLMSGILTCHCGQLMEWYHVLLSVAVSWILILAYGIIRANTGLNVINDSISFYISSLIFHNKPLSILTFCSYVSYLMIGAVYLLSNLKLCHYAKIPPRSVFITLVVGRLVTGVVSYVVGNYLLTNIHDICYDNNVAWLCTNTRKQVAAAVTWASTGPRIWFGGIYKPLLWLLLVGAILPVPFWLLHKKYPRTIWLKHVHIPILLMPAVHWYYNSSPGTFAWLLFGFLSHSLIRRWWYDRYSLLFSIAMDTGATISGAVIFFIFINRDAQYPEWWGGKFHDKCPLASRASLNGPF